jgi:LPXTG-motif cell wall-anchored protein
MSTSIGVFFTYYDSTVGYELGFIGDRLPETNTTGSALTFALLALSGALAAGAVIARRKELRA